ncbi:MAG: hypothetical protein ABI386_05355 [Rhodanobacter sp.]
MKPWMPRGAEWLAPVAGVLALLACLWLGQAAPQQALLSYLFAFLFFTGLAVGSLALAMVPPLTGGAWGFLIRPQVLAAARTLPLMALLALPILFGMRILYAWAHADVLAGDPLMRQQSWYLNPTFFSIRTAIYFALWLLFLLLFTRGVRRNHRLPRIAVPGLIVFALTTLLASTDWASSLLPHWHSSTFGMLVATGWMLAAMALAIVCTLHGVDGRQLQHSPLLQDLGNLLLMFVLGWAYLGFMQYLTIWIADLPAENVWYIPRTLTSWRTLAWFLIAFHFLLPFVVLLSRSAKRSRGCLLTVAAMLLVANLADALWLVVPGFRATGFALRWTDLLAPLGIGGLWLCLYLGQLRMERLAPTGPVASEAGHG